MCMSKMYVEGWIALELLISAQQPRTIKNELLLLKKQTFPKLISDLFWLFTQMNHRSAGTVQTHRLWLIVFMLVFFVPFKSKTGIVTLIILAYCFTSIHFDVL